MEIAEAQERLRLQAALWLVEERGIEPLVRAACDALVAGMDGDQLRLLAATSVSATSYDFEIDELVHAAMAEQGIPLPDRQTEGAQHLALQAMAVEAVEGRVAPRRLAEWAHRVIGHNGVEDAQFLVGLDDSYDCLEYVEETEDDLNQHAMAEAHRIVAAMPQVRGRRP